MLSLRSGLCERGPLCVCVFFLSLQVYFYCVGGLFEIIVILQNEAVTNEMPPLADIQPQTITEPPKQTHCCTFLLTYKNFQIKFSLRTVSTDFK